MYLREYFGIRRPENPKRKTKAKCVFECDANIILQTLYQIFATGFCMMNVPGISALF